MISPGTRAAFDFVAARATFNPAALVRFLQQAGKACGASADLHLAHRLRGRAHATPLHFRNTRENYAHRAARTGDIRPMVGNSLRSLIRAVSFAG
jgi:hypothetical protein